MVELITKQRIFAGQQCFKDACIGIKTRGIQNGILSCMEFRNLFFQFFVNSLLMKSTRTVLILFRFSSFLIYLSLSFPNQNSNSQSLTTLNNSSYTVAHLVEHLLLLYLCIFVFSCMTTFPSLQFSTLSVFPFTLTLQVTVDIVFLVIIITNIVHDTTEF